MTDFPSDEQMHRAVARVRAQYAGTGFRVVAWTGSRADGLLHLEQAFRHLIRGLCRLLRPHSAER